MRILHVLRAPVGGLFRHVRDLAREQAARGHHVGVLCDGLASDGLTETRLQELKPALALGLHRTAMPRSLDPRDMAAAAATTALSARLQIDIVHGHGAKGGAYARWAAARSKGRRHACYTPHGGSLHFAPDTLKGRVFMALERYLARHTSGLIFESRYSQRVYHAQVAPQSGPERGIPNGLLEAEFTGHHPAPDATDVLFIGELRQLKGVDVLLEALAVLNASRTVTATIVGEGPDGPAFKAQAQNLGLAERVVFPGPMPAAKAFPLGRCLAVPSRAESFPYIVLEAAACAIPLIATDVGGIGEIVTKRDTGAATHQIGDLIPPGNPDALAQAIALCLNQPAVAASAALELQARARELFSVERMTGDVLSFYESILAANQSTAGNGGASGADRLHAA